MAGASQAGETLLPLRADAEQVDSLSRWVHRLSLTAETIDGLSAGVVLFVVAQFLLRGIDEPNPADVARTTGNYVGLSIAMLLSGFLFFLNAYDRKMVLARLRPDSSQASLENIIATARAEKLNEANLNPGLTPERKRQILVSRKTPNPNELNPSLSAQEKNKIINSMRKQSDLCAHAASMLVELKLQEAVQKQKQASLTLRILFSIGGWVETLFAPLRALMQGVGSNPLVGDFTAIMGSSAVINYPLLLLAGAIPYGCFKFLIEILKLILTHNVTPKKPATDGAEELVAEQMLPQDIPQERARLVHEQVIRIGANLDNRQALNLTDILKALSFTLVETVGIAGLLIWCATLYPKSKNIPVNQLPVLLLITGFLSPLLALQSFNGRLLHTLRLKIEGASLNRIVQNGSESLQEATDRRVISLTRNAKEARTFSKVRDLNYCNLKFLRTLIILILNAIMLAKGTDDAINNITNGTKLSRRLLGGLVGIYLFFTFINFIITSVMEQTQRDTELLLTTELSNSVQNEIPNSILAAAAQESGMPATDRPIGSGSEITGQIPGQAGERQVQVPAASEGSSGTGGTQEKSEQDNAAGSTTPIADQLEQKEGVATSTLSDNEN